MLSDGLLRCVACGEPLSGRRAELACTGCRRAYPVVDGVPVILAENGSEHSARQAQYFDEGADAEFEIERPHGTPVLYRWLLAEKFRMSVSGLSLKGTTALVVCGGSGMDAEFLARAGARVISSDISTGAAHRTLERARRHEFDVDVITADVEQLPFADASIDVVYVHDGLHHLERPLVGLMEMARVARRVVCVTEPARATLTNLAVRVGLALEEEEAGNRVARLDADEVLAVLRTAGFERPRVRRYAMLYRHEPGRAMRILSQRHLYPFARGAFAILNLVSGRFGNKLALVAERTDPSAWGARARLGTV